MLASLVGLTKLRSLHLARNGLTSDQLEAAPPPAPSLTRLVLAGNQLRTVPASVAGLTGLVDLDLSTNMITVLPPAGSYLGASCPRVLWGPTESVYTSSSARARLLMFCPCSRFRTSAMPFNGN